MTLTVQLESVRDTWKRWLVASLPLASSFAQPIWHKYFMFSLFLYFLQNKCFSALFSFCLCPLYLSLSPSFCSALLGSTGKWQCYQRLGCMSIDCPCLSNTLSHQRLSAISRLLVLYLLSSIASLHCRWNVTRALLKIFVIRWWAVIE